jgi:uncharacterized caspase-like protein/uncharacterized protein YgiM (DUF1202 family)
VGLKALARLAQRLSVAVLLLIMASVGAWGQTVGGRVALVLGNGTYVHATPLPNPPRDARAVAEEMRQLGFEVLEGIDLDRAATEGLLRQFADRLQGASVGLFYYAGHGLQVNGRNYLAPVDAQLDEEQDLYFEAFDVELVLQLLERESRTSLIFLDACRDNPLARNLARSMGPARSQGVGRGLAQVDSGIGTLIAYATQPNNVAYDGTGEHSPFTAAVLEYVGEPGLEVRQMLSRVRETVIKNTDGRQVPWDHSSLTSDFYFVPEQQVAARTPPAPAPALGSDAVSEIIFWNSIQGSQNPDDIRVYLEQFPNGLFSQLARNRLRALEAAASDAAPPGGEGQQQASAPRADSALALLEQRESEVSRREAELQQLRQALAVQQQELDDLRAQTEARRQELDQREAEQAERWARLERERAALEQARDTLAQQEAALASAPDPEEMARLKAMLDARELELRERATELDKQQQGLETERAERLVDIDKELAARQEAAQQALKYRVAAIEKREQSLAQQQQQLEQRSQEIAVAREKSEAEREAQMAAAQAQLAAAAQERERLAGERAKLEAEQSELAELRGQNEARGQALEAVAAKQAERLAQLEQDRASLEEAREALRQREADLADAPDPAAMAQAKAALDAREVEIQRREAEFVAEQQALEAERSERLAALDAELAARQRAAELELQQRAAALEQREQALAQEQDRLAQLGRETAAAVEHDEATRQQQLAEAQAKLAAAEAERDRLAEERTQLEAERARLSELRESDQLRRTQLAALEAEQAQRQAELEQHRAALDLAQQELGKDQANLADTPDPDEIAQNSAAIAARQAELEQREAELREEQQALEAERTNQVAALDLRLSALAENAAEPVTSGEAAPGVGNDGGPSELQSSGSEAGTPAVKALPSPEQPGADEVDLPAAPPDTQPATEAPVREQTATEPAPVELANVEPRQQLERRPEEPNVVAPEFGVDRVDAEYVALKNSNVRVEPTTDSSVLDVLNRGTAVKVTGKIKGRDWYQIELPGRAPGYVHASLLENREIRMARADAAAAEEQRRRQAEAEAAARREVARRAAAEQAREIAEAGREEQPKAVVEAEATAERLAALQPQQQIPPGQDEPVPAERASEPRLTQASILGDWCSEGVSFRLTTSSWDFRMVDGNEVKFAVQNYEFLDDTIQIHWRDNKNRRTVTEFGQFSDDQRRVVQIRGRNEPDGDWHYYNRPFGRC